jgi:hypothetical protein
MSGNLLVLLVIGAVGVLAVGWTVFDAARDPRRPLRSRRERRP